MLQDVKTFHILLCQNQNAKLKKRGIYDVLNVSNSFKNSTVRQVESIQRKKNQ